MHIESYCSLIKLIHIDFRNIILFPSTDTTDLLECNVLIYDHFVLQRAKICTPIRRNTTKPEYCWKDMIHHIGLITPASRFHNIQGLKVNACSGWIVSSNKFQPEYLNEIQIPNPAIEQNIQNPLEADLTKSKSRSTAFHYSSVLPTKNSQWHYRLHSF